MEPITLVAGVALLGCGALVELTIRQYADDLPKLRERAPTIRRLNGMAIVLGVLTLVMSVLLPRL